MANKYLLTYVPDQVRTLSQVGTKKILKGGWAILELFEPSRSHDLKLRSQKLV